MGSCSCLIQSQPSQPCLPVVKSGRKMNNKNSDKAVNQIPGGACWVGREGSHQHKHRQGKGQSQGQQIEIKTKLNKPLRKKTFVEEENRNCRKETLSMENADKGVGALYIIM